jgi:hypothetical protein
MDMRQGNDFLCCQRLTIVDDYFWVTMFLPDLCEQRRHGPRLTCIEEVVLVRIRCLGARGYGDFVTSAGKDLGSRQANIWASTNDQNC